MILNQDEKLRDEIIFGKHDKTKYIGGIRRYENLNLKRMEMLSMGNFLNLEDCQNDAPSIRKMLEFIKKWKRYNIKLHGYVVEYARSDYRLSVEGINANDNYPYPSKLVSEFSELFSDADSFVATTKKLYCWYD